MAICGYICPVCEGKGYTESGKCVYCQREPEKPEMSDEQWLKEVHEGDCCGDPVNPDEK